MGNRLRALVDVVKGLDILSLDHLLLVANMLNISVPKNRSRAMLCSQLKSEVALLYQNNYEGLEKIYEFLKALKGA